MKTYPVWLVALLLSLAGGYATAQRINPGAPVGGSGGGVTVGDAVSGGAASRLLFSDASTQVSTATPVAVTSSLDLTSGTLDVGGACTLDSTLRVDGTSDLRGVISSGGSATCDSVGAAGAVCAVDSNGTVFSTGGTAAVPALIVKSPAVSASVDPGFTVLYGEDSAAWANVFANGTSTVGDVVPSIQTRHMGTAATQAALFLVGGLDPGADSSSATVETVAIDARRESGTYAAPSGSAVTQKPILGVRNYGTKLFTINVNGGLGLRHITPTALSGSVDNYGGCTTTPICRIDGGASSRDVTGIVPGFNSAYEASQSELFFVCAVGANNLVLKHDVTSTSTNRFTFNGGTDRTVLAGSCFPLIYDRTSQRWRAANGT